MQVSIFCIVNHEERLSGAYMILFNIYSVFVTVVTQFLQAYFSRVW